MTRRRRTGLVAARKAAGHTQESLAGALYIDRSTVIRWESGENSPWPYLWPKLAQLLQLSTRQLQQLIEPREPTDHAGSSEGLADTCAWLDRYAGWAPGTTRAKVDAKIVRWNVRQFTERNARRAAVGRSQMATALAEYYGNVEPVFSLYSRDLNGIAVTTSLVTKPEWLDVRCSLAPASERIAVQRLARHQPIASDGLTTRAAVARLAEAAALNARLSEAKLYRLLEVDVKPGAIDGTFGVASFSEYALTYDLLETELLDALLTRAPAYPVRARYLPDLASVLNVRDRLCAGGVLSLCAVARPDQEDYVLLIQQRSEQVLNASGKLAVIPKGFHQPITDERIDARIGDTVRRQLERELFARTELDHTAGSTRAASPMHRTRLSSPMRWLTSHDALRMECTGFGLNLVSGNYEFACLAVIDDETFWVEHGGAIEANWEAAGLQLYSTRDCDGIAELASDESWTNEGIFALLEGLRRLGEISPERVDLPRIK